MIGDLSLRDLPLIGLLSTVGAAAGDLLLYGGDFVVASMFFVVESVDLWLPFVSRLDSVAGEVPLPIPGAVLEDVALALTFIFLGYTAFRIYDRFKEFRKS